MKLSEIRKLGDPVLYQVCEALREDEISSLSSLFDNMKNLIISFRDRYGKGRAIAAPQLGVLKRVIFIHTDSISEVLINPVIKKRSNEKMEIWDDCMSFPGLLVRLSRHRWIDLSYYNHNFELQHWHLEDDMSELVQHECDHLDGILAIDRAENLRSFKWEISQQV